jgi:response regulator RpfG family c-di-GMP phosphodiesterase
MDTFASGFPAEATPELADRPQTTVLFVDDEPTILSALRRAFRNTGYRLLVATSAEDGLAILENENIDAVISDMQMPQMNGAEFLEQVFKRWPEIKRILLTGHSDAKAAIAAINLGKIWRYMEKPWSDAELIATVEQALWHRRLVQENAELMAKTREQNEVLHLLNTSLEQKVSERTGELRRTFLSTVQGFANLLERRQSHNAGHSRRVADHARQLAERLGLTEVDQSDIFLAGLLHDIGKLALADAVSGKPLNLLSPLDQQEYRLHPQIGQELLTGIPQLKQVASIVRHHHELMDGSGYPDQIIGLAIPIGARILAVANDYDALQRGSLLLRVHSAAEALEFIVRHRGKRYDPRVVDALLSWAAEKFKSPENGVLVTPAELRNGMVLLRDVQDSTGLCLFPAGRVVDVALIISLRLQQESCPDPIQILVRRDAEPATLKDRASSPRPVPRFREVVLSAARLKEGMVLSRPLHHREGHLLLARKFHLDPTIIRQLQRIETAAGNPMKIYIQVNER